MDCRSSLFLSVYLKAEGTKRSRSSLASHSQDSEHLLMAEFFPKNDPHNQLLQHQQQQQHHQQQRTDALARGQQYQSDDTDGLLPSSRQHHTSNELIAKIELKINPKKAKKKDKEKEKEKDKSASQKKEKASKHKNEEQTPAGRGSKAPITVNPKHGPQISQKVQQNPIAIVGALNESEQTAKIKILMKNVVRTLPVPLPLPTPPFILNPDHRNDSKNILSSSDMRNLLLAANHGPDEGIRAGAGVETGTGADSSSNKRRGCTQSSDAVPLPQPHSSSHGYQNPHNHNGLIELLGGATCADTVTMSEGIHADLLGDHSSEIADPNTEFTGSNCIVNSRSEADFLGELANGDDGGGERGGVVGDAGGALAVNHRLLHRECKVDSLSIPIPGQPHTHTHTHILLPLPLPVPLSLPWKANQH